MAAAKLFQAELPSLSLRKVSLHNSGWMPLCCYWRRLQIKAGTVSGCKVCNGKRLNSLWNWDISLFSGQSAWEISQVLFSFCLELYFPLPPMEALPRFHMPLFVLLQLSWISIDCRCHAGFTLQRRSPWTIATHFPPLVTKPAGVA